jgi:hypothetical protein
MHNEARRTALRAGCVRRWRQVTDSAAVAAQAIRCAVVGRGHGLWDIVLLRPLLEKLRAGYRQGVRPMYFFTRPVVVALIVGTLGFVGYELWLYVQEWAKGTVFAQSPALLGMGVFLLLLSAGILIFVVCRRHFSRQRNALH